MSTTSLITSLRECLGDILARYPVALAYLYGSAAIGKETPLSDIDIAVVLEEEKSEPASRLEIELRLEEEISRACGMNLVDVRAINDAPIMVGGEVVTNGVLLYCRDESRRVDFETSTRSAYFDFLPVAAMHRQAFFERLYRRGEDD